ncbi:MAG TPA: hypothetical protein VK141_08990, partial [Nitrosomonas sp.]|nr:hypothetical protein [Nitrosomonas sp.]
QLHQDDENISTVHPFGATFSSENTWQKMRAFRDGGWDLWYWEPTSTPGAVYRYSNLTNFYKTGQIFLIERVEENGATIPYNSNISVSENFKKKIVFNILGRMCHLLFDMSVPAHVHSNEHADYVEVFEDLMKVEGSYPALAKYWNANNVYTDKGGFINPYVNNDDPLHYLMYTTNQIADHFASHDVDGNNLMYPFDILTQIIPTAGLPTTYAGYRANGVQNIRDVTVPYAIRATAGLFYWFAIESGLYTPPADVYLTQNLVVNQGTTLTYQPGTTVYMIDDIYKYPSTTIRITHPGA